VIPLTDGSTQGRLSRMARTTHSYADLWTRVLAFAFDYIAIALYLLVLVAVGLAINSAFPGIARTWFGHPVLGQIVGFLTATLPVTLYFALFESSSWQATWGKRWRGLKVVRADDERLTRTRALGRTLLKFIPWELAHTCIWRVSVARNEPSPLITVGFVLVWILVGANVISLWISLTNQTLYDRLAGTYVVKSRG